MKHLLNNLSEEEKNSIREQHTDKIKIDISKFKSLMESKLGDVKPLVEQSTIGVNCPSEIKAKVTNFESRQEDAPHLSDTLFLDLKNIVVNGVIPHLRMDVVIPNQKMDEIYDSAVAKFDCLTTRDTLSINLKRKGESVIPYKGNISPETIEKLNCHCKTYAKNSNQSSLGSKV